MKTAIDARINVSYFSNQRDIPVTKRTGLMVSHEPPNAGSEGRDEKNGWMALALDHSCFHIAMPTRKLYSDVGLQELFTKAVSDILAGKASSFLPSGVLIRDDHPLPAVEPVCIRIGQLADWTEREKSRAELEVRNSIHKMQEEIVAKIKDKMGSAREAILIPGRKPLSEQQKYGNEKLEVGDVVLVRGKGSEYKEVFFYLEFYVVTGP